MKDQTPDDEKREMNPIRKDFNESLATLLLVLNFIFWGGFAFGKELLK